MTVKPIQPGATDNPLLNSDDGGIPGVFFDDLNRRLAKITDRDLAALEHPEPDLYETLNKNLILLERMLKIRRLMREPRRRRKKKR